MSLPDIRWCDFDWAIPVNARHMLMRSLQTKRLLRTHRLAAASKRGIISWLRLMLDAGIGVLHVCYACVDADPCCAPRALVV